MANRYVDSNATGSPNDGTTWATAFQKLADAAAVDTAGDTIWVAHNHAETSAAPITTSWAGTIASPTRIICSDSGSGEPPTVIATTATVSTTGANDITPGNAGVIYVYGIKFSAGDAANLAAIVLSSASVFAIYERCEFKLTNTAGGASLALSTATTSVCHIIDCGIQFNSATQGVTISTGRHLIKGGSLLAGGTSPTTFIDTLSNSPNIVISGFDFSQASTTMAIVVAASKALVWIRNCKLPDSWAGNLITGTLTGFSIYEMNNCDSADTNYRLWRETEFGSVKSETSLIKTGGASDGTTSISWKAVSNANAEWNHETLDTSEIVRWNETTGSAITVTVDILHDGALGGSPSVPLTDRDIWLEVQYLGTDGRPLALFATDAASSGSPYESNYLATAMQQENSSASWTTTGMSNPLTQKLSVTITPREKGFIHGVIKVAKASYTVYVDPVLQVS